MLGYWAMQGLRSALDGQPLATLRCAGVLLAAAAVLGTFAAWRVARGWGRSRFL